MIGGFQHTVQSCVGVFGVLLTAVIYFHFVAFFCVGFLEVDARVLGAFELHSAFTGQPLVSEILGWRCTVLSVLKRR